MTAVVSGVLNVGEASAVGTALVRRARGSSIWYQLLSIALMISGGLAGVAIARLTGADEPIGFLVGWAIYASIARRLVVAVYRKRFASKGLPLQLPLRLHTTSDALIYEVGQIKQIAQWACVTELFRSHGYWVSQAQGSSFFAPARFFSSVDAEREFVRASLAMMPELARANSKDAIQFANAAT